VLYGLDEPSIGCTKRAGTTTGLLETGCCAGATWEKKRSSSVEGHDETRFRSRPDGVVDTHRGPAGGEATAGHVRGLGLTREDLARQFRVA